MVRDSKGGYPANPAVEVGGHRIPPGPPPPVPFSLVGAIADGDRPSSAAPLLGHGTGSAPFSFVALECSGSAHDSAAVAIEAGTPWRSHQAGGASGLKP